MDDDGDDIVYCGGDDEGDDDEDDEVWYEWLVGYFVEGDYYDFGG